LPVSVQAKDKQDPFALDTIEDVSFLNSLGALETVKPIDPDDEDAFVDVPPEHWAYKAVKYLAEIGLLGGYDDSHFRGNRPVTRYELSVIIAKLVKNYNQYVKTGSFTKETTEPAADLFPAQPTGGEKEAIASSEQEHAYKLVKPKSITLNPSGEAVWERSSSQAGAAGIMKHGAPKLLVVSTPEPKPTPAATLDKTTEKPPATEPKKEDDAAEKKKKEEAAKAAKELEKKKNALPKQFIALNKKMELNERDVEILTALVDYLNKDFTKQVTADLNKKITDVSRLSQQSKQKIEQLQQDIDRFRISGGGSASYTSSQTEGDATSSSAWRSAWWSWYSKPRKYEDMYLYSDGTMRYQNITSDRNRLKNFKLRTLYGGSTSFGAVTTLLTAMDVGYTGFRTELSLNKYTVITSLGKISGNKYIDAGAVQFSLFNEPRSLCYVSHIHTWDDYDKISSSWGQNGVVPPEKNSVSSIAVRHPLPLGLWITTEFAHSTYYRPGFDYLYSGKTADFSPQYQYVNYVKIPELRDQDDSYLVLLDYSKGPLNIQPSGYIRLGPHFVSKYNAVASKVSGNLTSSMPLPISFQSMEAWLFWGTYKKMEKKFDDSYIFASVKETEPIFFDTSGAPSSMADANQFNLFPRLNNRPKDALINLHYFDNKINYYENDKTTLSWEYSNAGGGLGPMCIDSNYSDILDDRGNIIQCYIGNGRADCNTNSPTYDDEDLYLMLRFKYVENKFGIFWRTSSKAEYNFSYGIKDTRLNIATGVDGLNAAISSAIGSQGREYSMGNNLKYRLTDVSNIEMWYNLSFGRGDIHLTPTGKKLYTSMGATLSMSF